MSLLSKLGYIPKKKNELIAPSNLDCSDISIIIPVKNDQEGINRFLSVFFDTQQQYPKEIIIVDNNSKPQIEIDSEFFKKKLPVTIMKCGKTGPASARNAGAMAARGEWIIFTDSDCVPSENFLIGYLRALDGSVGYSGNVRSFGNDLLSRYYESQEILNPVKNRHQKPEYLVTANCMVWKHAFELIGGFNESFNIAGGEDIDMSFRLLNVGRLNSADSLVFHNFDDGLYGFAKRFYRYGLGNYIVSRQYGLDLLPKRFSPNEKSIVNYLLAHLQFFCLSMGYRRFLLEEPYLS